jgi:Flp pilus assembly protein TadG
MRRLPRLPRAFARDVRASVAVITALALPTLVVAAGTPIDLARQVQLRAALQNAADSAALAGATLLGTRNGGTAIPALISSYVSAATSGLGVAVTANSSVSTSQVSVTLSASLPTTFTRLLWSSLPVTVTSAAGGPGAAVTITATPNGSTAADLNTVYVYAVNADGTKDLSNRVELFDNSNSAAYPAGQPVTVTFPLDVGQRIAFELDNTTGGLDSGFYAAQTPSTNTYGSTVGTTNVFYSSDYPASLNTANPAAGYAASYQQNMVNTGHVSFDSAATACFVANGQPVSLSTFDSATGTGTLAVPAQQQNVVVNGGCANVTPGSAQNIDPTCLELNGQTMSVNWNDMGDTYTDGDSDRYAAPYADMSYSFSCSGGGSSFNRVALLH